MRLIFLVIATVIIPNNTKSVTKIKTIINIFSKFFIIKPFLYYSLNKLKFLYITYKFILMYK